MDKATKVGVMAAHIRNIARSNNTFTMIRTLGRAMSDSPSYADVQDYPHLPAWLAQAKRQQATS